MAIWTTEIKELKKLYESIKCQLPELGKKQECTIRNDDKKIIYIHYCPLYYGSHSANGAGSAELTFGGKVL